jgi:hypothetical protein
VADKDALLPVSVIISLPRAALTIELEPQYTITKQLTLQALLNPKATSWLVGVWVRFQIGTFRSTQEHLENDYGAVIVPTD